MKHLIYLFLKTETNILEHIKKPVILQNINELCI